MLYRPTTIQANPPITLAARLRSGCLAVLGSILKRHTDHAYLDGLRPEELEDLGLRRTYLHDYTDFR